MAYGDFSLSRVIKQFQIGVDERTDLFPEIAEVAPSEMLRALLEEGAPLALGLQTEKARSELIIAPILLEVRRRRERPLGFFSGVDFNVDSAQGLSGVCDYLLTCHAELFFVRAPVLAVVEAKNEDFRKGIGQCAAELVAAQIFNKQESAEVPALYGAVTTGNVWRFLRLQDGTLTIDRREYYLERVGKILGILLHMTGYVPV